jgi:hypothetical protein
MKRFIGSIFLFHALASAAPIFTLSPPLLQTTPPGGISNPNCVNGSLMCLIFSGTITPDAAADTFLNGIQISFTPATAGLVSNDNFFFANVPGFLASSDPAYDGFVFEIDVAPNAAPGLYHGTATLLGGINGPADLDALSTANFDVVVTPEPRIAWLLALGLALLVARLKTRTPIG